MLRAAKLGVMAALLLWPTNALAQSADKEQAAVLELGVAPERSVTGGGSEFRPHGGSGS